MKMEEFIRNVTEQIRSVRAREGVAREMSAHILDQAETYEAYGLDHDTAMQKAVREMGDPVVAGVELDRIHRPQTDWKMMAMALGFSIAGLIIMYTAGELSQSPNQFGRQCIFTLASLAVMLGIYFLDYSFIGRYAPVLYVLLTVVFFITAKTAPRLNGRIPSLLMMVYLYIPVFAGLLYRFRGNGYSAVVKSISVQFLTALLTSAFSDCLSVGFNVYLICMALLLLAIHKNWFKVNKKAAIIAVITFFLILPAIFLLFNLNPVRFHSIRQARLMGWLKPDAYADTTGYVYVRIREGLASAKLIGASGSPVFPTEASTGTAPFILVKLTCTFGILFGFLLVLALAVFVARTLKVVRRQKNQLGMMISAACFMVFLLNCLEGVLINIGWYPITSLQFPFLSYGGSTTLTYAVFIGLLLSVHRNERIVTDSITACHPAWRLSVKLEKR